ncbi:MAG TPA: DUF2188 domain-containing protein [Thermoanaerobaculia bacterium]|nr:DUF2188 domain-containing protein [Thermoanaerobaculia bacterium]
MSNGESKKSSVEKVSTKKAAGVKAALEKAKKATVDKAKKTRLEMSPKQKKVAAAAAAAAAGVAVAAAGVAVARRRRSRSKEETVFHVVPKDDRWEVRGEGAQRATSVHETKREAVAAARQLARDKEPSRLVVHRIDGSVQDSFAYGA